MSHSSQVSGPSPRSAAPSVPDFTPLIATLQATARDLLACSRPCFRVQGEDSVAPEAPKLAAPSESSGLSGPSKHCAPSGPFAEAGETRCFYRFPAVIKEEKELLALARVQDIPELLNKVYDKICATATLMKNMDDEAQMSGYVVRLFGEQLEQPLDMLQRTHNVLCDWSEVKASPVE